nr:hypothetical protein [Tanacetum cinerariifolium]
MVAILEKTEHNTDFHQIVDFLEASHIRYALTISPTVYVSHIRQFWSTTRIETTNQETKILAAVDGKSQTIFESSLRRHLKLNDEEGISSLPDIELFENHSLMGYNILPNQRYTFQKGQFSHQWKFLIHTIMQCLSQKSFGFNEFSSNIATAMGEGSINPTEPHHTPLPQEQHSPQHDSPPLSHPTPTSEQIYQAPSEPLTHRQYTRRAKRIVQSKALSPAVDEHTSALPYESSPMVTSLDADEGNMQHRIHELIELCTSLHMKQSQMAAKIKAQDLEISGLKERVKSLKEKNRRSTEPTQEDAPITGGIMEIGEELGTDESTELGSNDTKEMVSVLSSMEAVNILTSRGVTASVSPAEVLPAAGVPTVSGSFPTINAIFTIASIVTPYTRRPKGITIGSSQHMRSPIIGAKDKGKQKVVESEVPKKRKLQEQIDAQVAKEMEEELAREREKLELTNKLVKYQDHHAKILKYQAQQSKPLSKKEQREFYIAVLKSHAGWKTKHFRGMTLKQIKEKFIPVWKQLENFMPMSSKEEGERVKRQGLKIDQWSSKRIKTFEDVYEEELKGMIQLVPLEEVYVEALQVELKRLFEPDFEDQLWTHNQAFMHDPLDWKLYDTCGVHHVSTKDQEIFMLFERDYPLRRGLATVMIINKLQESLLGQILYRTHWTIKGVLSGKEEVNTASIPTTSTNVSPASANIGAASISQDTACAYIASQSNGFDKSKVECFNYHKMGHFARECRALKSQDKGRRDNYRQGSKVEEQAPKALMAIDRVGWD